MKAVVAAYNQEKALVGAFSVIENLRMYLFEALVAAGCVTVYVPGPHCCATLFTHCDSMFTVKMSVYSSFAAAVDSTLIFNWFHY